MRVDVNVSVASAKENGIGSKRVEVKNVSGAINVGRVVEHELLRHISFLEKGEYPLPETRRWDAEEGRTYSIRDKDSDPDYRFFLDPDLPCIRISEERKQKA
jgi:aspartyl-tRNA(Asn)/glutamyl-tRNA(Gln) amidotransferase subunit B